VLGFADIRRSPASQLVVTTACSASGRRFSTQVYLGAPDLPERNLVGGPVGLASPAPLSVTLMVRRFRMADAVALWLRFYPDVAELGQHSQGKDDMLQFGINGGWFEVFTNG